MPPDREYICTCLKWCQGGKAVAMSVWYKHKKQREKEDQMEDQEKEGQNARVRQQQKTRKRTSTQNSQVTSRTNLQTAAAQDTAVSQTTQNDFVQQLEDNRDQVMEPFNQTQFPGLVDTVDDNWDSHDEREPNAERAGTYDNDGVDENVLFNADEDVSSTPTQPHAVLEDLIMMQERIRSIRDYNFEDEKEQWTPDEFEAFMNPPDTPTDFSDHDLRLSIKNYIVLSADCAECKYEGIRQNIHESFPGTELLSLDQVRNRLKSMTGVLPLRHDMCVNSCVGFTGPYRTLAACPKCGEARYHPDSSKPRRQFLTYPLGPQLQALWRNPDTVAKLRYRVERTKELLAKRKQPGGIQVYDDVLCGDEYLNLAESGQLTDDDMLYIASFDGAQLYQDKESDTFFGCAILVDYDKSIRHLKEMISPLVIVGGPNAPKDYDSFWQPTFAHISALQRHGLALWNSATNRRFRSNPWNAFDLSDTVGMAALNGWVGHHGRNGCRLLCDMPGRHKPGVGTYYPAMLRPIGDLPEGSSHGDININSIRAPTPGEYNKRLSYVLESRSNRQYEKRRKETGIRRPSIVSALPKSIPVPKCFPADIMHLFLNLSQLLLAVWRGTIEHAKSDNPESWSFAVLRDADAWKEHGAEVAAARRYIPVCLESRTPRNPAEKINTKYKAVEYLVYIFSMCPALLYGRLPPPLYRHFCTLVSATRTLHRYNTRKDDLLEAHKGFLTFVYLFEKLYYKRKLTRLHFVRPCIHALTHLVPEVFRLGSLSEVAQWTMERHIGDLEREIRLHSNPYANLSERALERTRMNALYAMAPDLFPPSKLFSNLSLDVGDDFRLLHPRQLYQMEPEISAAFRTFALSHGWKVQGSTTELISAHIFARLLLPNGQIARSWWLEKKRPDEDVRRARMVKILLEGAVRYAEVQYFFLVEKKGTQYSLAAVKMYTEPDTDILSESVQQLRVCRYLGNAGICIIDAKWITEVVGMVPFKGFGRRVDPTEFYSMEKLRCPTVHDVENEEDDIEE